MRPCWAAALQLKVLWCRLAVWQQAARLGPLTNTFCVLLCCPRPQVLSPQALSDISGTAAKCTALALYSKVQHVPDHTQHQLAASTLEGEEAAPALPFCSQPLMVLAHAAMPATQDVQQPALPGQQQQQQQQREQQVEDQQRRPEEDTGAMGAEGPARSTAPALPLRTLHCFYALPPPGASMLPLAFADSCGELVHAELLDTAAARISGLGMAVSSSDSLVAAEAAPGRSPAAQACHLVLRRCLELLSLLRAASSPPNLLHSIAIAGSGMGEEERQAWQQLVGQDPGLQLELPAGAEVAVLDLQAPPPARWADPAAWHLGAVCVGVSWASSPVPSLY